MNKELIEALERLKFFNQRAGRELWADKPREIQDKDIESAEKTIELAISALSENKGDLISRQAVLDELEKWDWQDLYLPSHFKQILDDVPSVENKGERRENYISIDDVMSVFDDFMCGEVDEGGTETFLEMLKDKIESEEV